jgi:hypothetical protein
LPVTREQSPRYQEWRNLWFADKPGSGIGVSLLQFREADFASSAYVNNRDIPDLAGGRLHLHWRASLNPQTQAVQDSRNLTFDSRFAPCHSPVYSSLLTTG